MVISQGDVFWVDMPRPVGSEPGLRHPYVIVQNNLLNRSRIGTVVVCSLTSNLKRAASPGNVLLRSGEANLTKRSVANVSQIYTLDRSQLGKRMGALSPERVREIVAGVAFVIEPREPSPAGHIP
jgi:mRNA interferase MazF